jgi:putative membrane protein
MLLLGNVLIGLVLLLHVYIVLLETILFRSRGWKVFGFPREQVEALAPIVSNQGCYNGFLVVALLLSLLHPQADVAQAFAFFGLGSVAVAGVWGAATIMRRILYIQTVPALLGLLALTLSGPS